MGQLPAPRVNSESRAFTNVGLDFFGPVSVCVGRRREKRWGVIFTCLAIRAIHLEISSTLNTDSAIMAIRRFIARRGYPKTIYCDNGTNFRSAAKELKEEIEKIEKEKVIDSMSSKGINFKFNPPAASHMGGVWERLIHSVKQVLGKILHDQSLREETLITLLTEAENIINSRPLTKVSSDPNDYDALTPNHFLMGWTNVDSLMKGAVDGKQLRREWRKNQMLVNAFWARWVKEYLPSLNKRNKWTNDLRPLKENDVVVIVDENLPRYEWKLGRILKTYPGPDGRVRVVDMKTATTTYRRPATKLCRLEIEDE